MRVAYPRPMPDALTLEGRIARCKFRAWHRGTREADYVFGGFFDRYHAEWNREDLAWFEALLEEEDVDVLAWAMQAREAPPHIAGPQLERMRQLDYVDIPR
ncbi:hypothetical protein MTsN3n11_21740 [Qipengyuania sp. MTN3-11]